MATAVMLMTTTLLAHTQAWVDIDSAKRRKPRIAKHMHVNATTKPGNTVCICAQCNVDAVVKSIRRCCDDLGEESYAMRCYSWHLKQ